MATQRKVKAFAEVPEDDDIASSDVIENLQAAVEWKINEATGWPGGQQSVTFQSPCYGST